MKIYMVTTIFWTIIVNLNFSQSPDSVWTKTYGGSSIEYGTSVQQTSDGGYIITGSTHSFGSGDYDVWLIKTDALGDTVWTKTFGGISTDGGNSVLQSIDGGFIVVGKKSAIFPGDRGVWIIKTNNNGDTLWTKIYGTSSFDRGNSVQETIDGGYIIVGDKSSISGNQDDIWLIKMNAAGDTLWTKTFGGSSYDWGLSVKQTTDGGYIVVGSTSSFGSGDFDIWMIKTDASGHLLWTETFGGSSSDLGQSIDQTVDGGYIIVGSTSSVGSGGFDIWLIKTNSIGDTIWTKVFGGNNDEYGFGLEKITNEEYIITGSTSSFSNGDFDVWLIKTDSSGDILWTTALGGSTNDIGHSVKQTKDGGYIVVGETGSFGAGLTDVWLIKLEPDSPNVIIDYDNIVPSKFSLQQNYPNPFNPNTKIKYSIPKLSNAVIIVFDILGNEIETLVNEKKSAGTYEITWYAEGLPSGVYFYQLRAADFIQSKKMVLMK